MGEMERCPFCGQPLCTEAAVEHLHQRQAEFESSLRAEAGAAARATLTKERQALNAEKAALAVQVRKDVEREQAVRERQLERTVNALEQTVRKLNDENTKLQRRVRGGNSADIGEFGEAEIFDRLRERFSEDVVRRLHECGDILQEVRSGDAADHESAGEILYECKNTARWSNSYLDQIRTDGKTRRTPYLILVSRAFPRGKTGIFITDGVVVVDSEHAVHIAEVVRQMVVETHRAKLTTRDQATKTARLYEYLSTDAFRQPFGEIVETGTRLSELLQKERQTHERAWARREQLYGTLQRRSTEIDESIRTIIEAEPPDGVGEPRARPRSRPARRGDDHRSALPVR